MVKPAAKMRCIRLALIPALLLLATLPANPQVSANWMDPANWSKVPAPIEARNIVYFPADAPGFAPKSQVLDVFQNSAGAKSPVLVYMHGGAWNHGERPASWQGFKPWLAAGFTVVNVEYRLVDVAPAPAAVQDVRCALNWIVRNAAAYHFDTSRVVTYGTSAGGHLALMAAVLPAANEIDLPACKTQPHIAAVLDFYGPYHLEANATGTFPSPSVARWMGPDPQPSLLAKEHAMSPSTYVRKGIPPVFFAHGDADPVVPYQSDLEKKKDLDAAGIKNQFDTVPGGGHGKWTPEENQRVELDSLKFLQTLHVIQ
ncbi:MAG TPA: alpha/beta hydrolase [Acidobacteriaceae bacterium]|jgi:acetyl esterase/lipase